MSHLIPDLSPGNPGPVHCKSIRFSKPKGSPDLAVDFTLIYDLGDEGDPVLPQPVSHARGVLVAAMAGQPGGVIRADVLVDGSVTFRTFVNGEPDTHLEDLPAVMRRVTLHANEKNSRVVWLVRMSASPALGEVILQCLDSDVEVAFSPKQQSLPLANGHAVEPAPAPSKPSRKRKEVSGVESLDDELDGLPAEA